MIPIILKHSCNRHNFQNGFFNDYVLINKAYLY